MNPCYLALGSNQKNPERQLRQAMKSIHNLPKTSLIKTSRLSWTKAWGLQTQQDFCNAVVEIRTSLPPHRLLKNCQAIEKRQGRIRKKRWGPRTLDIDIILYANRTIKNKTLTIPHPHLLARHFVISPLLSIL